MTRADFTYLCRLLRERAAIVLEPGKEYLPEARLIRVVHEEGLSSLDELVARLRSAGSSRLRDRVVDAMATHETSFFRDVHPFEALRTTVVPALLARRARQRRLTIWSAACSSGQEPFSIAMLLREHFPALAGWHVHILASDLTAGAVGRARAGRYTRLEVSRGLPAPLLERYFAPCGTEWQIRDEVRRMVDFRELNLAGDWPALPTMDVVFLRNVLIYLDQHTRQTILGRVRQVVHPEGYLFLGSAEALISVEAGFERVPIGGSHCYRPRPPAPTSGA